MAGFGAQTIFDSIQSHAQASGLFDSVNTHEPKSSPGNNVHCAIYVAAMGPYTQASGLNLTSGILVIMARIYVNMLQEPQDKIDPSIVTATDKLMEDFSGDFTLGGNARNIALLGEPQLSARAGYIQIGDSMFRSMDITIPVVVSDVYAQAP